MRALLYRCRIGRAIGYGMDGPRWWSDARILNFFAQSRMEFFEFFFVLVIEQVFCGFRFRSCDGLDSDSTVRFTAYDVREKVSQTAVPLGNYFRQNFN